VQFPAGIRDLSLLQNAHNISGTHPATYSVAAGDFLSGLKEKRA